MLSILPPDFFIVGQSQTRFQPESVVSQNENAISGENGCLGKELSCGLLVALIAALDNGQLLHLYLPQPSRNRVVTMLVPPQADPVWAASRLGFVRRKAHILCRIPLVHFLCAKLAPKRRVWISNNPENGRVTTANPPMRNSPLFIGGLFFWNQPIAPTSPDPGCVIGCSPRWPAPAFPARGARTRWHRELLPCRPREA